ncbi:A.superbus venom factor 2-like isoform X2 [Xenia sp. Carnegie-2017]|uniref:A.superbus venom factor 2-like isoform X2 n=1 Tax=Xenia sp. Carnegie-2017 TaxID=2897299 RepID=UPI001F04E4FE|nr:A.superbus venom factor 2-like isoform X2 [Xenia sp. Carnegie-2017]
MSHTLANGEADVSVPTDLVKSHPKIAWFPEGKRLFIEAKVIEKATGHEETAYHNSIFFTNSPLTVSFKRSPNFFKPGVPFEVKVDVRHRNGEPADNIPIEIEAQTDQGVAVSESAANGNVNSDRSTELGHGRFVIDVPRTFTIVHLNIRVRAKISYMENEIVSEGRFVPKMHRSNAHNYLFVRLVKKGKVGQSVDAVAFVVSSSAPSPLTYLVVANGHIVTQGSIDHQIGVLTTITIRVTADMSPQARFIAFYRVNNELVADSAVIEVEEPTTKSGVFPR